MFLFEKKKVWMKIHLYLSLFFLPAAFIYAFTGALYLFGVKEEYGANIYEFFLDFVPTKGQEQQVIVQTLKKNNLKIPDETAIKNVRGNMSMGSIRYSATLLKDKNGNYKILVVERGIYGILLLMHKGKGKIYFDIIAVSFAISLMFFYFSGLVVTSFCKNKRSGALLTFLCGLFITIFMIYLSI